MLGSVHVSSGLDDGSGWDAAERRGPGATARVSRNDARDDLGDNSGVACSDVGGNRRWAGAGERSSGAGDRGVSADQPLVSPTLSPGVIELLDLEGRFADAVAAGGGRAFAEWFAEDAVVLNNGKAAVLGRGAIAAQAQWDPKQYKLTWTAEGAQMGPSNDMGFTWGHYEGRAVDAKGQAIVTSGRYMTVWRKTKAEGWKVAMDASATEPAGAGECCALPKP